VHPVVNPIFLRSLWATLLCFVPGVAVAQSAAPAIPRSPAGAPAKTAPTAPISSDAPAQTGPDAEPFGSPGRVALEALGGVLGAAVLGFAGAGIYALIEEDAPDGGHCDACGVSRYGYLALGATGALIGLPLGVHAVGEWSNSNGSLSAAYLGELGGVALAAVLGASLYAVDADRGAAGVLVLSPLFALGGALIGRELSIRGTPAAGTGSSGPALRLGARVGPAGTFVMAQGAF
jgi:hypothetical protein